MAAKKTYWVNAGFFSVNTENNNPKTEVPLI